MIMPPPIKVKKRNLFEISAVLNNGLQATSTEGRMGRIASDIFPINPAAIALHSPRRAGFHLQVILRERIRPGEIGLGNEQKGGKKIATRLQKLEERGAGPQGHLSLQRVADLLLLPHLLQNARRLFADRDQSDPRLRQI